LQGASGHLKLLGGLPLGDALRLPVEILLQQVGPLQSIPESMAAEMAVAIVARWKIDDSAHGDLLLKPWPNGENR
jgi:hypothetical protein